MLPSLIRVTLCLPRKRSRTKPATTSLLMPRLATIQLALMDEHWMLDGQLAEDVSTAVPGHTQRVQQPAQLMARSFEATKSSVSLSAAT